VNTKMFLGQRIYLTPATDRILEHPCFRDTRWQLMKILKHNLWDFNLKLALKGLK